MMKLRVVGIDLSCEPGRTGVAVAEWESRTKSLRLVTVCKGTALPRRPAETVVAQLARVIRSVAHDAANLLYAIDVPMGWPVEFRRRLQQSELVRAGVGWRSSSDRKSWKKDWDAVRLRQTDTWIAEKLPVTPFSVSTDKLGATAMLARHLLHALGGPRLVLPSAVKRSGVIEVYPAATFAAHGNEESLKALWAEFLGPKKLSVSKRNKRALKRGMPLLREAGVSGDVVCPTDRLLTEHEWDAMWCLVAAGDFLSAPSRSVGYTKARKRKNAPQVAEEGFIWCRSPSRSGSNGG